MFFGDPRGVCASPPTPVKVKRERVGEHFVPFIFYLFALPLLFTLHNIGNGLACCRKKDEAFGNIPHAAPSVAA